MKYLTHSYIVIFFIVIQVLNLRSVLPIKVCKIRNKVKIGIGEHQTLFSRSKMFTNRTRNESLSGTANRINLTSGNTPRLKSTSQYSTILQYLLGSTREVQYDESDYDDEIEFDLRKRSDAYRKTKPAEYPFAIFLFCKQENGDEDVCSGSLLTTVWVLTAAHCLYDEDNPFVYYHLYGGGTNITEVIQVLEKKQPIPPTAQLIKADKFMHHPGYETLSISYDIGLVKANKPFIITNTVKTIKLATTPWTHVGYRHCITTGFGVVLDEEAHEDDFSRKTHKLEVKKPCLCNFMVRYTSKLDGDEARRRLLCAKPVKDVGICSGDSGGGLACEEDGELKIRGTNQLTMGFLNVRYCEVGLLRYYLGLSPVEVCGGEHVISMFQDVYNHLTWINSHVKILEDVVVEKSNETEQEIIALSDARMHYPAWATIVEVNFVLMFFLN